MKVLVLGASGMLGHKLVQRLSHAFDVYGTVRERVMPLCDLPPFRDATLIGGIDVTESDVLEDLIQALRPQVIINAVGVVKQREQGKDANACELINERLPHRIAAIAEAVGSRSIFISTDCVFSGRKGNYTESDTPDATDLYGTSKHRGEVITGAALTLRTSIIGRELRGNQGLVEWFLSNRGGSVRGFSKAIFSGFPTVVLADLIKRLIIDFPELRGLYHASTEPISKYDLLTLLNEGFQCGTVIEKDQDLQIDRSLDSTAFRSITDYQPARWEELVNALAEDSTDYDAWRSE